MDRPLKLLSLDPLRLRGEIARSWLHTNQSKLKMPDPVKLYQDALSKAEELKPLALQYLNERKAAIEREISQLDNEIAAMTGEKLKPERVKGPKFVGKQVSFRLLVEILSERSDKTLNLRKEGYDSKWMRKLVSENPGKLELCGSGPWPAVTLLEK